MHAEIEHRPVRDDVLAHGKLRHAMPVDRPAALRWSGCLGVDDAVPKRALPVDVALTTGD
jgi:hypothetical protein